LKFFVFCAVHCNIIVQYKPTKCTFFKINIFNFLMPSTCFETEGSSSGRHLCIQLGYGTFKCIGMSSLVGRRVSSIMRSRKKSVFGAEAKEEEYVRC